MIIKLLEHIHIFILTLIHVFSNNLLWWFHKHKSGN